MWSAVGTFVQLDITTYCNARCPQCHRNNDDGLKTVDWLPIMHWTIDDFKKAFPPETLENIRHLNFCPTWGDPCLNPDLMDMVKYAVASNKYLTISIDTNGSMQSEDWWWEMSTISRNVAMTFAVDGIDQEMHSIYRRNTSLAKVLHNMEIFSNGLGKSRGQMVMFKHNQDYIEDIRALCIKHGAETFTIVTSNRFDQWNGVGGREFNTDSFNQYYDSYTDEMVKLEIADIQLEGSTIAKCDKGGEIFNDEEVYCTWGKANDITINWDGSVMPCCFINNNTIKAFYSNKSIDNEAVQYYIDHRDEYSIFNDSLENILNKPFWDILEQSWASDETTPGPCRRHCTSRQGKQQLPRLTIIAKSNE